MKKHIWIVAAIVLLASVAFIYVLSRSEAPQRDYFAEYETLRASRYTGTPEGIAASETLAARDRWGKVLDINLEVIHRASEAERSNGVEPELWFYPRSFADSLFDGHDYLLRRVIEDGRPVADRLFTGARDEALPRVMELLEHPDTQAAVAAVLSHEVIVPALAASPTLSEIDHRSLLGSNWSFWPDLLVMRYAEEPAHRLDAFRLLLLAARVAGTDPRLSSAMTMHGTERVALSTLLDEIVGEGAFSPGQGQLHPHAWVDALQTHARLRPDRGWFVKGQRLEVLDALDAIYRERPGSSISGRIPFVTTPIVGVSHHRLYSFVNNYFDLVEQAAGQGPDQCRQTEIDFGTLRPRIGSRGRLVIESVILFNDVLVFRAFDRSDANLTGALTVLALLAYQADHDGAAPASLDALVPDYLDAVPMDLYSAGGADPLVYRVDDDGAVWLYSRGPDLTDDDGVRASGGRDPEPGEDLVFLPRPE